MEIINNQITPDKLKTMAKNRFGNMVKAVVDIENKTMAVDAEFHSDLEGLMLQNSSKNENLWGINIYPELEDSDRIEFDSMINLRPAQNNRTRGVESPEIRGKIISIVNKLVQK
ncbi:hypothetical protein A2276_08380 [candidate division WOR-1 bacterium RIFOXYA12_FULL_43_27]|uniref:Uncharacterized protein n=1 Tax=candidate division WOR-1 bacterium RIFOXYC2_FULL_46_14 TaxID=1802587 RepID=A0A1F4U6J7_UNCSA|nr:MAG: hypothetical protein A2276_08380 [candidate division WOR-1 bacterium RIFOXYA12_FULL_43_27]OGC20609.1 MAG: hypothetical protein A2292_06205 [candidate division WOR-1 bacterium RIFOXYB2_FULL_46_45]OGC31654.1 MAG: hypothetical protein A2232_05245 [candidate division WOR-1 bacterium RIFOXYA2_FULL_46_56]OGC40450.1 MAG: hypothetical protein A2438_04235 [candidate division WOR-1 bacterium RIFOXYC2_FULL_46_14]